ncbi:MAG: tripartite tricarboxylate transporter permease [Nitrospinota bacterium]|nr:MAG: tripartite tricarboxylate transporter permease [Nitrospinota bacterium]
MDSMGSVLQDLLFGFQVALTPFNLSIAAIGVVLGTIIGAVPGLGPSNGVAILLPVTFLVPANAAIIFVAGIYYGACYGGAISSILLGIPGDSIAVATTFDGRPLALKGRGAQALITAAASSFVGGTVGIVLITTLALPLANFALKFGPPENFAIMMLAFATFVGLGGRDPFKSLVSVCLGLIASAIGIDIIGGMPRLIYGGYAGFYHGISFLVVTIGVYGIGEILATVEENIHFEITKTRIRWHHYVETFKEIVRYWNTFIRSALFGYFIGLVPAAGATPAAFMSYGLTKRFGRDRDKLGEGCLEGVVAPETANNAASTGAFLPMLTMGIPGSPTTAVILGALIVWGLRPGPLLFIEHRDFAWGLIASLYTSNIVAVLLNTLAIPVFVAILRIPFTVMAPLVVALSVSGGFAADQAYIDIWWVLIFGLAGYMFKKLHYPIAPLILALVLGDMTETALRQSLVMSQGSLAIFFTRPISLAFMIIAILLFLTPVFQALLKRARTQRRMAEEVPQTTVDV